MGHIRCLSSLLHPLKQRRQPQNSGIVTSARAPAGTLLQIPPLPKVKLSGTSCGSGNCQPFTRAQNGDMVLGSMVHGICILDNWSNTSSINIHTVYWDTNVWDIKRMETNVRCKDVFDWGTQLSKVQWSCLSLAPMQLTKLLVHKPLMIKQTSPSPMTNTNTVSMIASQTSVKTAELWKHQPCVMQTVTCNQHLKIQYFHPCMTLHAQRGSSNHCPPK